MDLNKFNLLDEVHFLQRHAEKRKNPSFLMPNSSNTTPFLRVFEYSNNELRVKDFKKNSLKNSVDPVTTLK